MLANHLKLNTLLLAKLELTHGGYQLSSTLMIHEDMLLTEAQVLYIPDLINTRTKNISLVERKTKYTNASL